MINTRLKRLLVAFKAKFIVSHATRCHLFFIYNFNKKLIVTIYFIFILALRDSISFLAESM